LFVMLLPFLLAGIISFGNGGDFICVLLSSLG
jgi:hypothetical protein